MNRRELLKNAAVVSATVASGAILATGDSVAQFKPQRVGGSYVKLSCNIYSFNGPLTKGAMTLDDVLEFCARLGFPAVDPTGYYFPNYPKVPPDECVYHIKRKALLLGLDISETGVRTDFAAPDQGKREADVELVKAWTECALKLGAPVLRVFSGRAVPQDPAREEATRWVVDALRRCADQGRKYGVMMALQNHADFVQTAEEDLALLKMVDSDWIGANLDIGSFRRGDPYEQIARVAPYAIAWQLKENLFVQGKETKTDLGKIAAILKDANYRGYVQLETLGEGDPKVKVPKFLEEVRQAIS
jgi:sugar phosphate isomerase/epimerase